MKKRAKNKTCSFLGKEKKIAGGETKKKTDLSFILLRMRIIELCCSIGDRSDPARHCNSLLLPLLCVAKPVSAPGILTRLVYFLHYRVREQKWHNCLEAYFAQLIDAS